MAKTLLDAVNETLKRVAVISGDSGELSSLTDGSRQRAIDISIQVTNEAIDALYSASSIPLPREQAEDTITLAAGQREYGLADDLVQVRWPFIDKTNNQYLIEYPGDYNQILFDDPEQDDTGLPHYGAISPVTGNLYIDRAPTAVDAGRVYTYQYDKDLEVAAASDEMPFENAVFRAMVPAWVQLWKREMRNEFDGDLFEISIGRAARLMTRTQPRGHWSPR